jgi:hypothetical protein
VLRNNCGGGLRISIRDSRFAMQPPFRASARRTGNSSPQSHEKSH